MAINHSYSSGCGVCLGVFHIIFGLASCGAGIASIVQDAYLSQYAVGIWAGLAFYLVTGIIAVASSNRSNSTIAGYYVMALLSVFVAMGQMGFYILVEYLEVVSCSDSAYWQFTGNCTSQQVQYLILHGILVIVAFLEWIIAMVSCCTTCSCCCNTSAVPTQTIVIQTTQPLPVQTAYSGATVMMPPPQAPYTGGQPAAMAASNLMCDQQPQGYSDKSQLLMDGLSGNPPVYNNQPYDAAAPSTAQPQQGRF